MAVKLNGWQRLWVFVSVPMVIFGLIVSIQGVVEMDRGDIWGGLGFAIAWSVVTYAIGWGIAWVRRGFKG